MHGQEIPGPHLYEEHEGSRATVLWEQRRERNLFSSLLIEVFGKRM
jgi:hypothetical protein